MSRIWCRCCGDLFGIGHPKRVLRYALRRQERWLWCRVYDWDLIGFKQLAGEGLAKTPGDVNV